MAPYHFLPNSTDQAKPNIRDGDVHSIHSGPPQGQRGKKEFLIKSTIYYSPSLIFHIEHDYSREWSKYSYTTEILETWPYSGYIGRSARREARLTKLCKGDMSIKGISPCSCLNISSYQITPCFLPEIPCPSQLIFFCANPVLYSFLI